MPEDVRVPVEGVEGVGVVGVPGPAVTLDGVEGTAAACVSMVVGFDKRPQSAAALGVAADVGRRVGARLHVVHAVDLRDYPIDPDSVDWDGQARRTLSAERAAVAAALGGYGPGWDFRAWKGEPAHALIACAEEVDAVMIVVGTRGEGWRSVVERLLSPSVSHRLIGRGGGRCLS